MILRLEAPEGSAEFESDARLVRLVLVNLVANALKFTEQGQVVVSMELAPDACLLRVQDSGPGIEPSLARSGLRALLSRRVRRTSTIHAGRWARPFAGPRNAARARRQHRTFVSAGHGQHIPNFGATGTPRGSTLPYVDPDLEHRIAGAA